MPAHCVVSGDFSRMTFSMAIHPNFAMCAAILFLPNGLIDRAWTHYLTVTDPLLRKAEAALLAISKAHDLQISNLLFEGDSSTIIENLQVLFVLLMFVGVLGPSFTS